MTDARRDITGVRRFALYGTLVLWWAAVVIPGLRDAHELPPMIEETRSAAKRLEEARERRAAEKSARTEFEKEFGSLFYASKGAEHLGYVLGVSRKLCDASSIDLLTIEPTSTSQEGAFQRFPVKVTLRGDLRGISSWMLGLESMKPPIDVQRIVFRARDDQLGIDAEITVVTFAWRPKEESASPPLRQQLPSHPDPPEERI